MSNWTERLQEEKRELEAKITSLDEFMQSSDCCELEPVDVSLMDELMIAMEDCLGWVNDGLERAEATRDEEGYNNQKNKRTKTIEMKVLIITLVVVGLGIILYDKSVTK